LLPDWDTELVNFYNNHTFDKKVWLCCTYIEKNAPEWGINKSYGKLNNLRKQELFNDYKGLIPAEHRVSISTTPLILSKDMWNKVGGFSEEFSPGIGSEIDLAKKLWDIGFRDFVGVRSSIVYHFQSKSTDRLVDRNSLCKKRDLTFDRIHEMPIHVFREDFLRKGSIWNAR
jgi:GT2 family glycosyltransferase